VEGIRNEFYKNQLWKFKEVLMRRLKSMMFLMSVISILFVICLFTNCPADDKTPVQNDDAAVFDSLKWLSGHWEGDAGDTHTEECWMEPLGGIMTGMNRSVKKSGGIFYEYLRIEKTHDGIVYIASPLGKSPAAFRLVSHEKGKVVFENLKHDYPQRIIYQLNADGTLKARIEGLVKGKPESCEWIWHKAGAGER